MIKKKILFTTSAGYKNVLGDVLPIYKLCAEKFDCYIALKDDDKREEDIIEENGIKFVNMSSSFYQYLIYTSEYVIDSGTISSARKVYNDAKWINIWHGIPIKKMMLDQGANPANFINFFRYYDNFISPSKYYTDIVEDAFLYKGEINEIGSPRYDEMFSKVENNIYDRLGIDKNKKVILYAPTFREEGEFKLPFDVKKLLSENPNSQLVVKVHYLNTLNKSDKKYVIDASSYPVINDLFKITDLLIADYSSLIFDYSLLNKDMVLYQYDLESYLEDRGVYFDLKDYFPNNIAYNEEELLNKLKNINKIDYTKFKEEFLPFEDGKSSERLYNSLITNDKPYDGEEIIFLVNQINEIGGVHNFIKTMAKNIKKRSNRKIILIGATDKNFGNRQNYKFECEDIDIILTPQINRNAANQILANTRGTIITTQMWAHKYYQRYLIDKNVIAMFHTDVKLACERPEIFPWEMEAIETGSFANMKSYVMLTKSNAEELKKFAPKDVRITYIENGIELSNEQSDFSGNFIFLGRIEQENKNVMGLIELGIKLKELNSNAKIEVYGDGPDKEQFIKKIEENKLENIIMYKGYTDNPQGLFKSAKGLVMTSTMEGQPYVILEAMTMGVPSILFNTFAAAKDLIKDGINGFLIKDMNYEDMAQKIDELNTSSEILNELSIGAKEEVKNYDYNVIMDKWFEEFKLLEELPSFADGKNRPSLSDKISTKATNFRIDALGNGHVLARKKKKTLHKIRKNLINIYQKTPMYKNDYKNDLVPEFINAEPKEIDLNNLKKVTIIVPAYNSAKTIEATLKSILKQSYPNIEVLIINDGSPDNVEEVVKPYIKDNFKYFKKENTGLGLTRNYGIEKATGDYVFFLDSDDTIPKNAIQDLVYPAMAYDLDVVSGKTFRIDVESKNKTTAWMNNFYRRFNITNLSETVDVLKDTLSTNKLYKKEIFKKYNLDFETGLYEDKLFTFKMYNSINKIGFINRHVYNWFVYGKDTSITTSKSFENFYERTRRVEEIFSLAKSDDVRAKLIEFYLTHDLRIYLNEFANIEKSEQEKIYELAYQTLKDKWKYYDYNDLRPGIVYMYAHDLHNNNKKEFLKVVNSYSNAVEEAKNEVNKRK